MREQTDLDSQTLSEWEALGFYYDYDDSTKTWRIRATRAGMERFCEALRLYAADPRNSGLSEHEHYGPYSYLKFVTWTEAKIISDGIYGRIEDFERLAEIVRNAVAAAKPGDRISLDGNYGSANESRLELLLEDDPFEVSSADDAPRANN
jgi:hypothetical protein